jgi:hypothetical protein
MLANPFDIEGEHRRIVVAQVVAPPERVVDAAAVEGPDVAFEKMITPLAPAAWAF